MVKSHSSHANIKCFGGTLNAASKDGISNSGKPHLDLDNSKTQFFIENTTNDELDNFATIFGAKIRNEKLFNTS